MSIRDTERSEHFFEATTSHIKNKIHDLVKGVGRLKVRGIANAARISSEEVYNILH